MTRTGFENLRVYQLAERLADAAWDIVRQWDTLSRDTVGKQLVRAADSIGANIAEGTGRGGHLDNRRFVRIARGSLYETQHWLRRAYCRRLLTEEKITQLKEIVDELAPSLNAYLTSIRPKPAAPGANNQEPITNHKQQITNNKQQITNNQQQ